MQITEKPKLLCVDDEPQVLEGLVLHLRRRYQVTTATSGAAGLDVLGRDADTAVVISDMRMPGMDGAAFLARVREAVPDTARVLLTGHADLDSAIAAVNDGQIFRFLTKPCTPAALLAAVDAAAEQHRLVTAERVLLERTLHGSIKALTDVLALTNPASFGRAARIKQQVSALAVELGMAQRWQVEVAAMLSQLGYIILPAEVVEKVQLNQRLSPDEAAMVSRAPAVTDELLRNIPRLDDVREILRQADEPFAKLDAASSDARARLVARGSQLIQVALDLDALEMQGNPTSLALATMRARADRYDPVVLEALETLHAGDIPQGEQREISISAVEEGMVFADDVKTANGTLLVARGFEVTAGFVERLRNLRTGLVKQPVRVIVRRAAESATSP